MAKAAVVKSSHEAEGWISTGGLSTGCP